MNYIVVVKSQGTNYFLQMRKVVSWFFSNNHFKHFKKLNTAIKNADMQLGRFRYVDSVHVFGVEPGEYVSSCEVRKWVGTDKEVYSCELLTSFIRHDRTHEQQLCIYQLKESLCGKIRDSYGNIVESVEFPNEESESGVSRIKEYFGYTENNSY